MTRRPTFQPEPDALPIVETSVNTPVFVDGVYAIDVDRHGLARLILTAEQREPSGGTVERVVAARLVLPRAVMAEVATRMLRRRSASARADTGHEVLPAAELTPRAVRHPGSDRPSQPRPTVQQGDQHHHDTEGKPMHDRRSFLRGLAGLPLIGGGVTLIGNPTAAAVPVTETLLERYALFLTIEAREALIECRERKHIAGGHPERVDTVRRWTEGANWAPASPWMVGLLEHQRPSARAAVLLSAAGVPIADALL